LEAYINDFGSAHFGDEYYYTYLDRLELASKLVALPRVAIGLHLQDDAELLNRIDTLIKCRNKLVHHRTFAQAADSTEREKQEKKLVAFENQVIACAKDAIPLLHTYSELLHKYDRQDRWAEHIFIFTTEGCY
jgi:hypothetical protein